MLSTEPSTILFGVLFVRLSRIFIVPLAPLVSITIAASSSLIFLLWTIISDRLSPLFLLRSSVSIYSFPYLFFPVTDSLSLFFYNISLILSFSILAFIFSTVLITILICIFHSNYSSCWERFHGIHIYLVNDSYLKKNGFSRFCIYILAVTFLLYLHIPHFLLIIIKPTLQITISYYPFTFFPSDKRTRKSFLSFIRLKKVFFFPSFSLYHFSLLFRFITADSHVFLVHPLSVTLFFSFLLVAKQILRLSFHSFVFNRTMRRWISWFSSLLSVSLITVLR